MVHKIVPGESDLAYKPLAGMTVLECPSPGSAVCVQLAVDFACRIAADLGATVYRLERAEGDPLAAIGPATDASNSNAVYDFVNAGKSILSVNGADYARTLSA